MYTSICFSALANLVRLAPEFSSDLVADDFSPINLAPSDGQLSSESFKGCVRHRLVILNDRHLQGREKIIGKLRCNVMVNTKQDK